MSYFIEYVFFSRYIEIDVYKRQVKGLSEGYYVIEETKAPDGYAKLKNTINKTISVDENAPQTVTVEEKVTNKTESWLPETGGMGTVCLLYTSLLLLR